jgi:endonuclease/exonuclease/phosphatase family metal-dependent hydrolase
MISHIILLLNALIAGLLLLAAYSPYVMPEKYPLFSCAGLVFPLFLAANFCFLLFWLIFHYKFSSLSLIALIICIPQIRIYFPLNPHSDDLPTNRIKILSYNVMSFNNMERVDGENPILQYIAKSNADIVCLQEYATSHSTEANVNQDYIDNMMKSYPYRDITTVGKKGNNNKLALFSRFPIILSHRILYKSDYNGSVYYELVIEGDTVTLINNHLESNKLTAKDKAIYEKFLDAPKTGKIKVGARSLLYKFADASVLRATQARMVAHMIAKSPYRSIIVCGDFNDSPISYAHQLISHNLTDAYTQSGQGPGISYNQNKFYFRIDNILISNNLKSYNCTVDRSIKSSDHYPIWCYISKK